MPRFRYYALAIVALTVLIYIKVHVKLHVKYIPALLKEDDIIGRAATDPLVIEYIKSRLILPSEKPYNLTNPHLIDFSQDQKNEHIKPIFQEAYGGFFVEVGAFDGEQYSNSLYWEREKQWTGLLIEPNPANFEKLKHKQRKAHLLYGCLCTTDRVTMVTFQAFDAYGRIDNNKLKYADEIRMPCFPFYSILAALRFPTVHFLTLDIEGLELAVLKTVPLKEINIQVIFVEFNKEELFGPLKDHLEQNGYSVKEKMSYDGLFVKKSISNYI